MSLDVYLIHKQQELVCEHCGNTYISDKEVYQSNITHNLGKMAAEANIYFHLWRPEEIGIQYAHELIEPITKALIHMKNNPDFYKQFNAPNGWGIYENFIVWIENYLNACVQHPNTEIKVSR